MTLYEYVAVFFLIIIGLGVAQLLQGIGQLLKYRQRINIYWVHLVWLVVLLMLYLGLWFNTLSQQERTYDFFLFLLDFSWMAMLYLLTLVIFPDFPAEGVVDLRRHYFDSHRPFFGVWTMVWVFMVLTGWCQAGSTLLSRDFLGSYIFIVLSLAGATFRNERFHAVLAVLVITVIVLQSTGLL